MNETLNSKKTILHLPVASAELWCIDTCVSMQYLWMREIHFRDSVTRHGANSLQAMMIDGRKSANPHLRRASELREECILTRDLLYFVVNMREMLAGKRRTPFEDQTMSQDEARSWLATKRRALKQKIRREQKYRDSVPYPDKNAATEAESAMQGEIVLLLDELLKTYPPKQLPRPKKTQEKYHSGL